MEAALREEYRELYSLDEMQSELLSSRTVENVVRSLERMDDESAFEFFSILCEVDQQSAHYLLESFCEQEDKRDQSLRVLLPFAYIKLVERLASTRFSEKMMFKLQSQYGAEMGSKVRMPLRFTTDTFKRYLFGGSLRRDLEEGNLVDLGVEDQMSLRTEHRLQEILAIQDMHELYVNLNYFSKFHIPFDYVAAVRAVLRSQARKDSVMPEWL